MTSANFIPSSEPVRLKWQNHTKSTLPNKPFQFQYSAHHPAPYKLFEYLVRLWTSVTLIKVLRVIGVFASRSASCSTPMPSVDPVDKGTYQTWLLHPSEALAYPNSSTKRKLFETKTQAESPGHCPAKCAPSVRRKLWMILLASISVRVDQCSESPLWIAHVDKGYNGWNTVGHSHACVKITVSQQYCQCPPYLAEYLWSCMSRSTWCW